MSAKHRIAVIMHKDLVPPAETAGIDTRDVDWKTEFDVMVTLEDLGHDVRAVGVFDTLRDLRKTIEDFEPHIVFNLLEEFAGLSTLDHNVVSYLELLRAAYTGCNPRGLMLSRDKALSKHILAHHKIPVPKHFLCPRGHAPRMPRHMEYPVIVKSQIEDASLGISQASVVHDADKLKERIAYLHDGLKTDAIVEQYIEGRELYVGIMGNHRLTVLPTWELKFESASDDLVKIATRKAKWDDEYRKKHGILSGHAADLPKDVQDRIARVCKRAYKCLYLNGYARIDLRLSTAGVPYIIEANPNPGIAYGEDFPEAAEKAGIDYDTLLSRIVSLGLSWHEKRG